MSKKSLSNDRPTISIVGPGNLGSALALTLVSAKYSVKFLAVRSNRARRQQLQTLIRQTGARAAVMGKQSLESDVVWIAVPDDAIGAVARSLAKSQDWKNKIVFHSSGALTSDELSPLQAQGARVASVHPLMTFVRGAAPEMAGVPFAVEGDPAAVRVAKSIVEGMGGNAFAIKKETKVLYHAFGSFASPLVIALMASMEQVAAAAGIRKQNIKNMMVPLLWQTLRNYVKYDASSAFSGPLVRGDVATVRKHLAELNKLPQARQVYLALAKAALQTLPVKNRTTMQRELH